MIKKIAVCLFSLFTLAGCYVPPPAPLPPPPPGPYGYAPPPAYYPSPYYYGPGYYGPAVTFGVGPVYYRNGGRWR